MNNLKSFLMVLALLFGLPWLVLVVYPWMQMSGLDRVEYAEGDEAPDTFYPPVRTGLELGSQVYARNGCAYCHTQMIRPTFAGADMWRPGWAGREDEELSRETRPRDYLGERFAYLGVARIGPDLSNVGNRIQDASWHHQHLFNPRSVRAESVMPSFRNLYERRQVSGTVSESAVATEEVEGILYEFVPSNEANALVMYLLAMRKDHQVPDELLSQK